MRLERLTPIHSNSVDKFLAPRPLQTALSVDAYQKHTGIVVPPWQQAIRRHLEYLFS